MKLVVDERMECDKKLLGDKIYLDTKNGYPKFKDSDMFVHKWMAERKLGRKLKPNEVVHHKDRDKRNFRPENLKICKNQFRHNMLHTVHKRITGRW